MDSLVGSVGVNGINTCKCVVCGSCVYVCVCMCESVHVYEVNYTVVWFKTKVSGMLSNYCTNLYISQCMRFCLFCHFGILVCELEHT